MTVTVKYRLSDKVATKVEFVHMRIGQKRCREKFSCCNRSLCRKSKHKTSLCDPVNNHRKDGKNLGRTEQAYYDIEKYHKKFIQQQEIAQKAEQM